ncbi:MAG: UDP-glucose--hexose-1-phosphate uridylyltransferase [Salinibacter sp.]
MPEAPLFSEHPHRRRNPLTDEWVLVSHHRADRPWQGQTEDAPAEERPAYDPDCYLCPGNERAGDAQNPDYEETFVFDNDFSALYLDLPNKASGTPDPHSSLFAAEPERGRCRVICYTPRHDVTMARMSPGAVRRVVDVWADEYQMLGRHDAINHVQIFENKGQMMGCSNPHPHEQIWAQSTVPTEVRKEATQQSAHYAENGRTLLSDYLSAEIEKEERIVCQNEAFVVLVPYWGVWPYETLVLPRRPASNILELTDDERDFLAEILVQLTTRYDNLFRTSFPYSAGLHQAPTDGDDHPEWHFHIHYYPPLLRSATVKKFMVGYEMLGAPQRDFPPEHSAERLRTLSGTHYRNALDE